MSELFEVVVIGSGNAAMCAAHAAREKGRSVLVLERASQEERGGNTAFTTGAIRTVYRGVEDLARLMPDLSDNEIQTSDFGSYTEKNFFDDMARTTQDRCNPDMAEAMIKGIFPTLLWIRELGIRFAPIWGRQAVKVDGRFRFRGGLTIEVSGGGPGLVEAHYKIAKRSGIVTRYESMATHLLVYDSGVHGVKYKHKGKTMEVQALAVVLATGGFQANLEWRTRYLGPNWIWPRSTVRV